MKQRLNSDLREWANRTFRQNLRATREQLGLTQVELANRAGMKPGYICVLESGCRSPEIGTVAILAAAMGVSQYDLTRERPGDPPPPLRPNGH